MNRVFSFLFLILAGVLPAQHAIAASPSVAEGVLEIVVEDHPKFSRTRHFLNTAKGRLELQFKGKEPKLHAGSTLRVSGALSGSVMLLAEGDSTAITQTATAPLPNTFGEQTVAVLLVNFSDDRTQPYTLAQANDVVFNQTSGFLKENSFQKTWLSGASFGWLELPIAKTCDGAAINSAGRQAAASAGIDLSGYGRVMYIFASNSACGWSGMANVGGTLPSIWINGWLRLKTVGHEVGHTFGLRHAHSLECEAATLGSACTTWEYGDTLDIMGGTAPGHFGAFSKERLGWLNNAAQPAITTVQASGRYSIDAYSAPAGSLPKALKIRRGTDATTGSALWYYVEYRQPIGYDNALAAWPDANFLRGLVVRSASDADMNSGLQLDTTPNSSSFDDWADAALPFGQAYTDTAGGVMVVAISANGSSAEVDVTLNAPAGCSRIAPVVATSGGAQAVAAGTSVSYTLSVTNKDGSGCGASTFDLRAAVPAGWSASLGAPSVSVSPGALAATTLVVTAPAGTAAGAYSLGITATNASASSYAATANTLYSVVGGLAASVVTDKASYKTGDTVSATAKVTSGSAALAGASVSFVFTKADGSTVVKAATSDASGSARASYKLSRKDPSGAWQVKSSASYTGLPSAAANGAFTVQ